MLLLAETHRGAGDTEKFLTLLQQHSWNGTASIAQPSERSEKGNVGGVVAAVKNYHNNRPLSACTDERGRRTPSAFLTGRALILQHIEILACGGYLEGVVGFSHANHRVLRDID